MYEFKSVGRRADGIQVRTTLALIVAGLGLAVLTPAIPAHAATPGPTVAVTATPGGAWWTTDARGRVTAGAGAPALGSVPAAPARPVVAMAAHPGGRGYWLATTAGGIFTFGDARYHGSTGATRLNRPIVAIAATPTGNGYWLTASEDDVWLAARCAVLPGIRIGAGSVVGLGTVVHRDVPPDVVVGPSPMAVLKELPQAE